MEVNKKIFKTLGKKSTFNLVYVFNTYLSFLHTNSFHCSQFVMSNTASYSIHFGVSTISLYFLDIEIKNFKLNLGHNIFFKFLHFASSVLNWPQWQIIMDERYISRFACVSWYKWVRIELKYPVFQLIM